RLKDIPEAVAREHLTGAGNDGLPEAAAEMLETYAAAADARERLQAVFDAKPFDEAGLPIVPGVVHLAPPDLGQSFISRKPVTELIADRLPVTLLLNIIAFPIVYLIAIPSGMLAAARKGSFADVGLGALFVALWSIPIVWAGTLAMGYLANEVTGLGAFPVNGLHARESGDMTFLPTQANGDFQRGYILDTLWHAALPVACLVYAQFAVLSKQTRAAMLENYSADYVRTARAKGVAGSVVLTRHVFRNSLLPLITMFVTIFPAMLGGSVVVERVFSVPGMGSLLLDAIYLRDREVLLANALIIALVNMLALLLADILYAAADPRISYK
ncbi:MAG: ABC transporter permease, partial [Planctomycetota bacterium]